MMNRQQLGKYGENLAARFLERQGFQIMERNFRTRWGEIDLIARRNESIHFIEVKSRLVRDYGEPEEAIHRFKKRNLLGAAKMYVASHQLPFPNYQIDSVSILFNPLTKSANIRYFGNIVLDN